MILYKSLIKAIDGDTEIMKFTNIVVQHLPLFFSILFFLSFTHLHRIRTLEFSRHSSSLLSSQRFASEILISSSLIRYATCAGMDRTLFEYIYYLFARAGPHWTTLNHQMFQLTR